MPAAKEALRARAAILRAVREVFHAQAFTEVETPIRVSNPGQEVFLDAFAAPGDGQQRYLITSPEYHMKRLVAAGHERIFQIGRVFRRGESGRHHESEFTMIEWYRAGAPVEAVAEDCERLLVAAAAAAAPWGGRVGPTLPFARVTVRELVAQHAGLHLAGDETPAELAEKARRAGVDLRGAVAWDDVFFQLWLDRVEPELGGAAREPVLVFDWPAPLAALARLRADDPRVCERFELYAAGLELANAFGELADPVEQRRRFEAERARRAALGKDVYPIDEKLLAALPGIEGAAGAALGFDRLCMWALGRDDIADVVAFSGPDV